MVDKKNTRPETYKYGVFEVVNPGFQKRGKIENVLTAHRDSMLGASETSSRSPQQERVERVLPFLIDYTKQWCQQMGITIEADFPKLLVLRNLSTPNEVGSAPVYDRVIKIKEIVDDFDQGSLKPSIINTVAQWRSLAHEMYHAIAHLRVSLRDGDNVVDERKGLVYSVKNGRGKRGFLVKPSLEEGLAEVFAHEFLVALRQEHSEELAVYDLALNTALETATPFTTSVIAPDESISVGWNVIDSRPVELVSYPSSVSLVTYLCEVIPNFRVLAEKARLQGETLALARALLAAFPHFAAVNKQSVYRFVMGALESDPIGERSALQVLQALKRSCDFTTYWGLTDEEGKSTLSAAESLFELYRKYSSSIFLNGTLKTSRMTISDTNQSNKISDAIKSFYRILSDMSTSRIMLPQKVLKALDECLESLVGSHSLMKAAQDLSELITKIKFYAESPELIPSPDSVNTRFLTALQSIDQENIVGLIEKLQRNDPPQNLTPKDVELLKKHAEEIRLFFTTAHEVAPIGSGVEKEVLKQKCMFWCERIGRGHAILYHLDSIKSPNFSRLLVTMKDASTHLRLLLKNRVLPELFFISGITSNCI